MRNAKKLPLDSRVFSPSPRSPRAMDLAFVLHITGFSSRDTYTVTLATAIASTAETNAQCWRCVLTGLVKIDKDESI